MKKSIVLIGKTGVVDADKISTLQLVDLNTLEIDGVVFRTPNAPELFHLIKGKMTGHYYEWLAARNSEQNEEDSASYEQNINTKEGK